MPRPDGCALVTGSSRGIGAASALALSRRGWLVEVQLFTGRKHQIRLQLANIGCPILGDRKYEAQATFDEPAIALCCVRLAFDHPTTHERLEFEIRPPANWQVETGSQ